MNMAIIAATAVNTGIGFAVGWYSGHVLTPGNPAGGAIVGFAAGLAIVRGLHSE